MKDIALAFYREGFGCSQCIFKAAEKKYNITIDEKTYRMTGTLNAGIGIGGMCAVLTACVMILGIFFDEETAKRHRLTFLNEFHKKNGGMNCSRLIALRRNSSDCSGIVYDAASILEKIIGNNSMPLL